MDTPEQINTPEDREAPAAPLSAIERRILGVLMEKARTTPDSYPLTLNALVTACNQKTARVPVMNLTEDEVLEALDEMKRKRVVVEVHGAGRVPKYRHLGYDYMNVRGAEAAVMTELLLRGEQTLGDLRARASRLEPIADLAALQEILQRLKEKHLIIELTPPGRGQIVTHNLYPPEELEEVRARAATGAPAVSASSSRGGATAELDSLKQQVAELRQMVEQLCQRVERLESSGTTN